MLWRRVRDHRFWPTYKRRKFTEFEAWVDLLFDAAYMPRHIRFMGQEFDLREGQLVFSQAERARRWKWQRNTVADWLHGLYLNGEAIHEESRGVTMLTICKAAPYLTWEAAEAATPGKKLRIKKENPFLNKAQVLVQHLADSLDSERRKD